MSDTYNGWRNRETWLVNIWFNPESKADVESARAYLEELQDNLPPIMKDFCSVDDIDWAELLAQFDDETEETNEE